MKRILVLAGPSAVGKTTVMTELLSRGVGFEFIRSATTRAPRGDGHDAEYIYLTDSEFRERISMDGMLEYTEYGGNLYGTPASEVERIFSMGRIPLLILDINGVKTLKSISSDFYTYSVYITANMETLDSRLYERAERDGFSAKAMEAYERRKAQNRMDIITVKENPYLFDATVENTLVSDCADSILKLFFASEADE